MSEEASPANNPAAAIVEGVVSALMGYGKLLERDYWAVIDRSRLRPSQVIELIARRFPEFAPVEFAAFHFAGRKEGRSLKPGDELVIDIPGIPRCAVRVVQRNATSFTLGTLPGHPEAGRITFGAYRNRKGDVIFHIRSRARSGSRPHLLGFVTAGDPMQTNTWTEFVNRVAVTVGEGVVGFIHADKRKIDDEPDDPAVLRSPTFLAEAD